MNISLNFRKFLFLYPGDDDGGGISIIEFVASGRDEAAD